MRPLTVFSVLLLATCAPATPAITIPLTRIHRTGAHLKGVAHADRDRAAFFTSRSNEESVMVPATNLAYSQYTVSVGIGNPPTYYNLAVDTGSSNTFCGTGIPYVRTNTSISTGEAVYVSYGISYFAGVEFLDQVTLGPNLVIANQSIGDARLSAQFGGVDGLIGIGPVGLTQGTLIPGVDETIPTVMNNLASQGLVENQILGIYFSPAGNTSDINGAVTYGGDDSDLYFGNLTFVPVTETPPASSYWGIDLASVAYGGQTIVPGRASGIVDTGTTLVLLSDDWFSAYMNAIPEAVYDEDLGLIVIPPSSVSFMEPLTFTIGGGTLIMDVTAQLIPMEQNIAWGGADGQSYGVVAPLGSYSGGGLDFILGQKFMEGYYVAFDADNERVGFAQTINTFTDT